MAGGSYGGLEGAKRQGAGRKGLKGLGSGGDGGCGVVLTIGGL